MTRRFTRLAALADSLSAACGGELERPSEDPSVLPDDLPLWRACDEGECFIEACWADIDAQRGCSCAWDTPVCCAAPGDIPGDIPIAKTEMPGTVVYGELK